MARPLFHCPFIIHTTTLFINVWICSSRKIRSFWVFSKLHEEVIRVLSTSRLFFFFSPQTGLINLPRVDFSDFENTKMLAGLFPAPRHLGARPCFTNRYVHAATGVLTGRALIKHQGVSSFSSSAVFCNFTAAPFLPGLETGNPTVTLITGCDSKDSHQTASATQMFILKAVFTVGDITFGGGDLLVGR